MICDCCQIMISKVFITRVVLILTAEISIVIISTVKVWFRILIIIIKRSIFTNFSSLDDVRLRSLVVFTRTHSSYHLSLIGLTHFQACFQDSELWISYQLPAEHYLVVVFWLGLLQSFDQKHNVPKPRQVGGRFLISWSPAERASNFAGTLSGLSL